MFDVKIIITLFREGVFFNTFVYGSLGIVCENVSSADIPELENFNPKHRIDLDAFYHQFEVFKKIGNRAMFYSFYQFKGKKIDS
mgnify:CR=1 FL=1